MSRKEWHITQGSIWGVGGEGTFTTPLDVSAWIWSHLPTRYAIQWYKHINVMSNRFSHCVCYEGIMRHDAYYETPTKFCSLPLKQHFAMQSHILNLESHTKTVPKLFLLPYPGSCVVSECQLPKCHSGFISAWSLQLFHANQNVSKKCLKM